MNIIESPESDFNFIQISLYLSWISGFINKLVLNPCCIIYVQKMNICKCTNLF